MTISVVVMAHPKREEWVPDLISSLGGNVSVVWDGGWNDRHITGLRAMQAYDSTASHHLIIQDDAIVCKDLIKGVEKAVEFSEEHPIALYTGATTPKHQFVKELVNTARSLDSSWFAMEGPWWGVGIVLPVQYIEDLTLWYEKSDVINYDRRISRWFGKEGVQCLYTVPSLVEHRTGKDNPSLISGRTGTSRRAHWFIGEDASALDIDWSKDPVTMKDLGTILPLHKARYQYKDGTVQTATINSIRGRRLERSPDWERIT